MEMELDTVEKGPRNIAKIMYSKTSLSPLEKYLHTFNRWLCTKLKLLLIPEIPKKNYFGPLVKVDAYSVGKKFHSQLASWGGKRSGEGE